MDSDTLSSVVGGAIFVGILVSIYFAHWRRRRSTKRQLIQELLKRYFEGGISPDQLARHTREIAGHFSMRDAELYSLVTAAFQSAVDARPAHQAHSKEDEGKLLSLLAASKREFGLTDRYQIEAWRAGRE